MATFNKISRNISTFGKKVGQNFRSFGQKMQHSHVFRKAENTLHQINNGLGIATQVMPFLSPLNSVSKMLEAGAGALNRVNFGGQESRPPPPPMLQRS
jgi:hypothetical protein